MKEIPLTQGKVALVDDDDYVWLHKYKWHAVNNHGRTWYACRSVWVPAEKRYRRVAMHREILGLGYEDKRQGDHCNHNGLDNRRDNIRICSHAENLRNKRSNKNSSSRFLGVSWCKRTKKWFSLIESRGKSIWLGRYIFEELAALAYDFAALKYHREFANFNF